LLSGADFDAEAKGFYRHDKRRFAAKQKLVNASLVGNLKSNRHGMEIACLEKKDSQFLIGSVQHCSIIDCSFSCQRLRDVLLAGEEAVSSDPQKPRNRAAMPL
jgi:hypothetical protein